MIDEDQPVKESIKDIREFGKSGSCASEGGRSPGTVYEIKRNGRCKSRERTRGRDLKEIQLQINNFRVELVTKK